MRARHDHRAISAALSAVFLLALGGDALGTHPCPHHGGAPAADHAAHGDPATEHGSQHDDDHGPCTCVGRCHAGTAPPLPVPILLGAVPVPETPADPAPGGDRTDRATIVPFSLPWANAPPTL